MSRKKLFSVEKRRGYTAQDAADILGISRVTVVTMISDGRLSAVKSGGEWKISDDEIARMIDLKQH